MMEKQTVAVIGGGAAGFFAAITAAENHPGLNIIILEQGHEVLGKVKISGGGRCNVTHACFDVRELVRFYPRGRQELMGPFHRFNCEHTVGWFEDRGVSLKTEADGRMFPVSNRSQTIVDCLAGQAAESGIKVIKQAKVTDIMLKDGGFTVTTSRDVLFADFIIIASGGNPTLWKIIGQLGHSIIPPVPSLFTFNINNGLIKGLEGVSVPNAIVRIPDTRIETQGAVLITHTGLSGPAILKLSAFGARILHEKRYTADLEINWTGMTTEDAVRQIKDNREQQSRKQVSNFSPFDLPNRFWLKVLQQNGIPADKLAADLSKNDIANIAGTVTRCRLQLHSKNTNKDEFVTAGGVSLKEVDFKTMESKNIPHLYFAGEVLDIDAVTGGFNFQAAWTTGFIAGSSVGQTQ